MNIYSVYDRAADKFGPLFEQENDTAAMRAFADLLSKVKFKEDFTLYYVGPKRTIMQEAEPVTMADAFKRYLDEPEVE